MWDFTDSSYRPSLELSVTHTKITSMEFLTAASAAGLAAGGSAASANTTLSNTAGGALKQQLLAIGDDSGTLHIFELSRNLTRPVHKEESVMATFLDRELKVRLSLSMRPRQWYDARRIVFGIHQGH